MLTELNYASTDQIEIAAAIWHPPQPFSEEDSGQCAEAPVERWLQSLERTWESPTQCRKKAEWTLTASGFTKFLGWLSSDWEEAGQRYEQIRSKLLKFFARRGSHFPEELFDRTVDRVCTKIDLGETECSGNPVAFCYGIARFVALESWRETRPAQLGTDVITTELADQEKIQRGLEWLERGLNRLSPSDRDLITAYYEGEGPARIRRRKLLASQLGGSNALRIRLCRVRAKLRGCEGGRESGNASPNGEAGNKVRLLDRSSLNDAA